MKFEKEYEDPIALNIGFPYNILPKGYPNRIRSKKIQETINHFLNDIKRNAAVESTIYRDIAFINLGLFELNNRESRKQSKIAFGISILSLIVSTAALCTSVEAIRSSNKDSTILQQQLDELKAIRQSMVLGKG